MNEKRIIDPEKIHLVKLQTLQGYLNSEAYGKDGSGKDYEYQFDASIGVKASEKIVGVKLNVDVKAQNLGDQEPKSAAAYTHELIFVIDNLDDFVDQIENQPEPKVDRLMLGTLLGIAYSTIRGIVYTRTQGQGPDYRGILLPVIDPKKLLKSDEKPQASEPAKTS
jgi:hypothetical protein